MPNRCNAFLPGEWVQIAEENHLASVLKKYRNGNEILEKLRPKVGQRFRIIGYSFPHGAGVIYEFKEISGPVFEECVVDWTINEDDESSVTASRIYNVRSIEENNEFFVLIEDRKGRVFSKLWRAHPSSAITEISEIASMRSRGAFEVRFGFNGDHLGTRKD